MSPGHDAAGDGHRGSGHGRHQGEAEAAAAPGHQERQQEDLQQPPAQVRYLLIYLSTSNYLQSTSDYLQSTSCAGLTEPTLRAVIIIIIYMSHTTGR